MSPITAKTYTTDVICLRTYDFGEGDKVLHLYSPEHGRISAVAKGVKRSKSKLAGACELLNLSEVQLSHGKNLDLLIQYQPKETFVGLRSDLLKLAYGLLFAELVNLTATEADSEAIFAGLKQGLHRLDQAHEQDVAALGIAFQLALLHTEGYRPVLDQCIFTAEPLPLGNPTILYYCFCAQLGGLTVPALKRQHLMKTHGFGEQWVNVSATTLRLLADPFTHPWRTSQFYKAQKFIQYYFKSVFDRKLHAFELVFNLLEMNQAEEALRGEPCEPEGPDFA